MKRIHRDKLKHKPAVNRLARVRHCVCICVCWVLCFSESQAAQYIALMLRIKPTVESLSSHCNLADVSVNWGLQSVCVAGLFHQQDDRNTTVTGVPGCQRVVGSVVCSDFVPEY